MATAAKPQKDKPVAKLTPRPTAASAARAARNAMNRNLTEVKPNMQRPSPQRKRSSISPTSAKHPKTNVTKPALQPPCDIDKYETNPDIQGNTPPQNEPSIASDAGSGSNTYVVDAPPASVTGDVPEATEITEFELEDPKNNIEIILEDVQETDVLQQDTEILLPLASRPETTMQRSRSLTPKSLQSSRPNTPNKHEKTSSVVGSQGSSRPSTPAHPGQQRRSSSGCTGATSQRCNNSSSRPNTPNSCHSVPNSIKNIPPSAVCTALNEDNIKTIFAAKQKQFHTLKKELDIKQQAILEVFDNLQKLNERMSNDGTGGGEGLQIQELVVFNVGDWTREEVVQLCKDAAVSIGNDMALELLHTSQLDENVINSIDANVNKVPANFADLCLQAFSARQELIDWIRDLIEQREWEGQAECMERISQYNTQGLELCEALRDVKAHADSSVAATTRLLRAAFLERSTLISVGESLVRELARLRADLEAQAIRINEIKGMRAENDYAKELQEAQRQLEEERASRLTLKEKLGTTEGLLRQTRVRVTKMDRQLREAEASIVSLTSTVKTLEDQSRQREVHLEARARKLKESLKTGEITNTQILQQRDALQTEIQLLKQQLEAMNVQHKVTTKDMNTEINDLKAALEDQRKLTENEIERNRMLENNLNNTQKAFEDYKNRHPDIEHNTELPTEREIDLWAELQATKDTLRITEDEVTACKREKVRFLETLAKISESENKIGMQQKLAAELLSKEEIIGKMQIQIRELTKNIKLNEQKVIQYEQYVRDLHAHGRAVANCQEAPNGIKYEDLQQEIMTLKMNLLDSVHRNEELSEVLAQKEQQLEQQDKTSRAQARIIKVREELINLLKNKETEQSLELSNLQQDLENRMKIVDKVNKQIAAKADEIQELFVTLENKQQQIHRLEKIVLALEEQQRRAQAQRTRHEEKIATLEHELAAGARRDRRFFFF